MRYRKKPVVIEAVQFTGSNQHEITMFISGRTKNFTESHGGPGYMIETLEGYMKASPGDWIIKGVQGEFYPCKPEIFAATYEPAN
jgi:hypothetical protein